MGDNCQIFRIVQIDLKCKKNAERFIKNFAKFTGNDLGKSLVEALRFFFVSFLEGIYLKSGISIGFMEQRCL